MDAATIDEGPCRPGQTRPAPRARPLRSAAPDRTPEDGLRPPARNAAPRTVARLGRITARSIIPAELFRRAADPRKVERPPVRQRRMEASHLGRADVPGVAARAVTEAFSRGAPPREPFPYSS